eukprot:CAMPEP_0201925170 /NCGR_PEP_ID=MMETSP0903-20130614/14223_1 /ASSEMBLY_ACC=CAM_ASM_000552 /TAXON_ID=420261 /ORGANISM="Thalassiosira antarctica, Strain CCMP982" /LENGTH=295 /DNA_ID=CAMNT_0048462797 /DNA_START=117 /DNA_END=1004 /DNA_ORIENTATION=+
MSHWSAAITILTAVAMPDGGNAFVTNNAPRPTKTSLHMASPSIGIFFGTSTGSTDEAAHLISATFGDVASDPIDIDEVQGSIAAEFAKFDSLVVGTPTWETGADTERSGTGWDEVYYGEMQKLDIAGKKVAVFGLGDSVSYAENYADATGELHDVFESLGCKMIGYTSAEGYKHEASKAIRGELFCGLALDAVNEEELTEDRVKNWVAALLDAGITSTDEAAPAAAAPVASPSPQIEEAAPVVFDDHVLAEEIIAEVKNTRSGYVANYNPRNDKTMWISTDGKSSYITAGVPGYE